MALQASPRQQPAIPPDAFSMDTPPVRHHYAQQASPQVDERAAMATRSPRSPRSNGNRSQPGTPLQTHRSPVLGSGSSGSTTRPVTIQVSSRSPAIATATGTSSSQPRQYAEGLDRQIDGAIVPPSRTSSHQRAATTTGPTDFHLPDRTRSRSHSNTKDDRGEGTASARARRDIPISPAMPSSPSDNRAAASVSQRSRTEAKAAWPVEMSRDNSEILNRMVVTDPEVDRTREQQRLAEAVPGREEARSVSTPREENNRDSQRRRQDFSSTSKRKETRFGDYVLGQTLGEGEFGKVKLGWKRDGSVEVAIKLIRRENLNTNPSRLPKIYREISILQGLSHPNIVRLHEMVETERHIGIILEYASGGELFDYILTHRYLKDNAARRLFAQLVSGVGYLHRKGIVHRDLKLENLLLDRNRNIIITDFGFANTFDPNDELGEDVEANLGNREFVKRMNLERVENGHRRGDLMQTSCGSPCYAAPELVVTDSLYTGRKVDVWSCGVILYAMLAGYLPFDDDPANPEGDNINLLYKYIVSTPLTFPEYVSPHARDLLRRILVPDPRKRADLFEVAKHSWLAEYEHVVKHITMVRESLTNLVQNSSVQEPPALARSASVREPTKSHSQTMSTVPGLSYHGRLDDGENSKRDREAKRRTVQVEYVAPQSQTARGEVSPPPTPSAPKPSTRTAEASSRKGQPSHTSSTSRKPLPQSPKDQQQTTRESRRHTQQVQAASRSPRSISESTNALAQGPAATSARPATGGSMSSGNGRLPSRGNSYGQPLAPTVAATNAQGSLAQPKGSRNYTISAPVPQQEPDIPDNVAGRPVSQRVPVNRNSAAASAQNEKGHKRANTFGSVFGRSGSLFGSRSQPQSPGDPRRTEKRYPPTSMKPATAAEESRPSVDHRRPSFGFNRKNSDVSRSEKDQKQRRFSLLPASFSLKAIAPSSKNDSSKQADSRPGTQPVNYSYSTAAREHSRHVSAPIKGNDRPPRSAPYPETGQHQPSWRAGVPGIAYPYGEPAPTESDASFAQEPTYYATVEASPPTRQPTQKARYPQGFNEEDQEPQPRPSMQQRQGARVLHKPNRKFADAWDRENEVNHHSGSSGAARRVMDFFRRRGKARAGEDR